MKKRQKPGYWLPSEGVNYVCEKVCSKHTLVFVWVCTWRFGHDLWLSVAGTPSSNSRGLVDDGLGTGYGCWDLHQRDH